MSRYQRSVVSSALPTQHLTAKQLATICSMQTSPLLSGPRPSTKPPNGPHQLSPQPSALPANSFSPSVMLLMASDVPSCVRHISLQHSVNSQLQRYVVCDSSGMDTTTVCCNTAVCCNSLAATGDAARASEALSRILASYDDAAGRERSASLSFGTDDEAKEAMGRLVD